MFVCFYIIYFLVKYLGSVIRQDGRLDEWIKERIGAAGKLFNSIQNIILTKQKIPKDTKVQVYKKVAIPIMTYASET